MNKPILILPTAANKSWARLRKFAASLRDHAVDADVRGQARALALLLDAWIDQRHSLALAKHLLQSIGLLRQQLIEFNPPEFATEENGEHEAST